MMLSVTMPNMPPHVSSRKINIAGDYPDLKKHNDAGNHMGISLTNMANWIGDLRMPSCAGRPFVRAVETRSTYLSYTYISGRLYDHQISVKPTIYPEVQP